MSSDNYRIFTACHVLPRPDYSSGFKRFFSILQLLAKHHQVDLCITRARDEVDGQADRKYREELADAGVKVLQYRWQPVVNALATGRYDLGIFEFYWNAERHAKTFRRFQPDAPFIVDSVDVHFVRQSLGAQIGAVEREQAARVRRKELTTYRNADAVIVVSEEDSLALAGEGNMPPVFVIPNIMPLRKRASIPRGPEVLFVGGFRHHPNIDGLRWFVKDVWPLVRGEVADAVLTVVGSNPTGEVYELGQAAGVEVVGYVPETNPYLDRARVSIAPLRYGAGMKGKVNEAMASGVPVVTTSVGAQGLHVVSGEDLIIADDRLSFSEAVIDLMRDSARAERLGKTGQNRTMAVCDPQKIELALEEMLSDLMSGVKIRPLQVSRKIYSTAFHSFAALRRRLELIGLDRFLRRIGL